MYGINKFQFESGAPVNGQFKASCGFLGDRSGQFAIIAAVLAVPLLAGVGLAVDYTAL